MAIPTGRCYKRVAKQVPVEIARSDPALRKETATSENISVRGLRVSTAHGWRAGDYVLLSSPFTKDASLARVVYCQHLGNQRFAIGLELLDLPEPNEDSR
jgi:hypothetical protein